MSVYVCNVCMHRTEMDILKPYTDFFWNSTMEMLRIFEGLFHKF
jgi:hypothetical protein